MFFLNKKFLMQTFHGKFGIVEKIMFPLPRSILPSASNSVVQIREKPFSEFNMKYSGSIDCFSIHATRDHGSFVNVLLD